MIEIICNDQTYTYNAYHIVKAFYPVEEVSSKVEEKASNYVTAVFENGEKIEVPATLCMCGKEGKEEIDRYFYQKLSEKTGKELSWGMLTGLNILGVSTYYQEVIKAIVILIAVLSDHKR